MTDGVQEVVIPEEELFAYHFMVLEYNFCIMNNYYFF